MAEGIDFTKPDWLKPLKATLAVEHLKDGTVLQRIEVVDPEAICVGRHPRCDLVLAEARASRYHLILASNGAELFLFDLSAHGTAVNGVRAEPRTYRRVHVGDQLQLLDAKGNGAGLLVLDGPDELRPKEGEIDAQALKEAVEHERQKRDEALKARKEARRLRDGAAKLQQRSLAGKVAAAAARAAAAKEAGAAVAEQLREVTWGQSEYKEAPLDSAAHMLDESGMLDTRKIDDSKLTDKQRTSLAGLVQKQQKLTRLMFQRDKFSAPVVAKSTEAEFEDAAPAPVSHNPGEIERLSAKIEKLEDEVESQVESMLVSLGYRNASETRRERKTREALYDTHNFDDDDDFFDRTAEDREDTVVIPCVEGTETASSLRTKKRQLESIQSSLRERIAKLATSAEDEDDSLAAFMAANDETIAAADRERLSKRLGVVEKNLAEVSEMHARAEENRKAVEPLLAVRKDLAPPAKPAVKRPAADKPAKKPAADKPAVDKAAEKPAADKPAADKLAVEKLDPEPVSAAKLAEPETPAECPEAPASPRAPRSPKSPKRPVEHFNLHKGGLQVGGPAPAKKRKVYTVALPPASRDAAVEEKAEEADDDMWVAPEGQRGDGKIALNAKLGY